MPVDIASAEQFVLANGRLLERHILARLLHGAAAAPVLDALRAYRNADGGFGHALEPDVRTPGSEPTATLQAIEVLAAVGAQADPMVAGAAAWVAATALPDGGVPFVLPGAAAHPHAPWMVPGEGGSQLTFAFAGALGQLLSGAEAHAGADATRARLARATEWLERATEWCWAVLADPESLGGYVLKFALDFLDRAPDAERAGRSIEALRPHIGADGSIPVPGGIEGERLTALDLSPRPGLRSRALFSDEQIGAGLDQLEDGQRTDGGWMFSWLGWSPAQTVEWRGIVTVRALATLSAHDRILCPALSTTHP
ncbi:hypothetical protein Ga0074812_11397 [Parafrankia irregularis]|uniref:Prenyltransferase and squalene oxidase repeat-containing protein n=1 Tax=Parafrankia irregularis TaxID=795642 RepID=A0A0S4QR37_9ACTN|nr:MULTISPECIES: hypothetical protein [Parafrankia]MBE3206182.1 hypothetical protein [Parafrankia sp. CH37]CUU57599.1 hypothetical protein Ga0074812_11397 [Parafrankia irregularis]